MGEVDPQVAKRMAAEAYDYDGDPRWAEYWANILIPPHLASCPDVLHHYKLKFYQRFIDPDLVIETMPSPSSSHSAFQPASGHPRPHNSGPNIARSTWPQRNPSYMQLDQRTIHFSVNAWVLIMAVLGVFPLMSMNIASKAYRLSLLGTGCCSLYSLFTLYGVPRALNLLAIQFWFRSVFPTKDFIRSLYCLIFFRSQMHLKFALIPVICWALEHAAKFLKSNFTSSSFYRRYLQGPCLWVESNTITLFFISANAEIALGFLHIISLFSWQHNILQTFMYWQLLKLMYHAPVTARYHQRVWAKFGHTINPYIYHYAPFLLRPLSAIQMWWVR